MFAVVLAAAAHVGIVWVSTQAYPERSLSCALFGKGCPNPTLMGFAKSGYEQIREVFLQELMSGVSQV